MDSLCKKFKVPTDILLIIERINHKKNTKDLIHEFNNIYSPYWREKFRNYEKKYLSFLTFNYNNNTQNNKKRINKLKILKQQNLFHIDKNYNNFMTLYNGHHMVFNNTYKYIGFYFSTIIIIKNNGKFEMNFIKH
jgi:hypothetical protein|tara:strand:+ start:258 stop:662 length:405 start_codon:yes stop_codon:yes gene_type:complete